MLEILRELVTLLKEVRALVSELKVISDNGGVDLVVKFNGDPIVLPTVQPPIAPVV